MPLLSMSAGQFHRVLFLLQVQARELETQTDECSRQEQLCISLKAQVAVAETKANARTEQLTQTSADLQGCQEELRKTQVKTNSIS